MQKYKVKLIFFFVLLCRFSIHSVRILACFRFVSKFTNLLLEFTLICHVYYTLRAYIALSSCIDRASRVLFKDYLPSIKANTEIDRSFININNKRRRPNDESIDGSISDNYPLNKFKKIIPTKMSAKTKKSTNKSTTSHLLLQNRFGPLSNMNIDNETNASNVQNNSNKDKIPPIVFGVNYYKDVLKILKEQNIENYSLKFMSIGIR